MIRRCLLSAVLIAAVTSASARAAERPNVVVVLVDDFGWGDPACYGNTVVKTPNMDRLAKEGVRFTQGYVAAPICSPSRCGIITGHFPGKWKITSFLQTKAGNKACAMADYLDPQAPSLPRMLKDAGYATAHIGKWHLGGGRDVTDAPKFHEYGYELGLGTYESPEPAAPLGLKTTPWGPQDKLEPQQVPRHERSKWMVDQTLEFLKKNRSRPCFVNVWLDDTHTPFVPSEEQMKAVRAPGEAEQRTKYKAVLAALDVQLGRLLDGLKGTNTLVLFLGDNGPSQPFARVRSGGLRGQKLSLYEGGVRVPFVAWWPEVVKGGGVNDKTVIAAVDFLPTLSTLCGARLPKGYTPDGEDMAPAIKGESPARTKPLFWEYGRNDTSFAYPMDPKHRSPNVAVRDGNWKLLVNADGSGVELYDLAVDPKEDKNVAGDKPDVVKRLTELALAWRKSLP
ncbi:sulfatase-like hydrolase/transferase [Gemmata sp. JC673]|uniref:Sulfatase-like hydrolase/transferase n=1 Tax=Gemmata algarum TaxID=2975278 RepID=A0ABU5EY97_9BACT|nr:sulfatase-like hydrolase/transferase [Gemmata algarum]MDY3559587.1 sulfatase-like hydrolase/transferase [Gemmata algarum]